MFAIWWKAWNVCDPSGFPIPVSMFGLSRIDLPPGCFLFSYGAESGKGIILRRAWEMLEPVARDLMMYCWCAKMSGSYSRKPIAHPVMTKKQAEQQLSQDLCDELSYLLTTAITYVSNAPRTFT